MKTGTMRPVRVGGWHRLWIFCSLIYLVAVISMASSHISTDIDIYLAPRLANEDWRFIWAPFVGPQNRLCSPSAGVTGSNSNDRFEAISQEYLEKSFPFSQWFTDDQWDSRFRIVREHSYDWRPEHGFLAYGGSPAQEGFEEEIIQLLQAYEIVPLMYNDTYHMVCSQEDRKGVIDSLKRVRQIMVSKEAGERIFKTVVKSVFVWLVPVLVVYILGWGVAWVIRGFCSKEIEND